MMTIYGSNGNSSRVGAGVGGVPGATGGGGPARVLLLGYGWEPMQEALSAVAGGGAIVLMGPEPVYDAGKDYGGAPPHILLLAPGEDIILEPGHAEPGQAGPGHRERGGGEAGGAVCPPALRCVAGAELDAPDLYDDADDFIVAPCAPAELTKRILRLARRGDEAGAGADAIVRVGGIALNPATYQVSAGGRPVDLAWLEFRLLLFLMQNVGKVFTRDQLLASVWGVANIGGTRTVDVHIRRLRYKLETGGATYFRTVKNVGYGMMEP